MPERWLPVVGYEGSYEVSDLGRVRSILKGGIIRKAQVVRPGGHLKLGLRKDGTTTFHWVHRLVLKAFVGPPPPGMWCRHLDGNAAHNVLQNLCWGTPTENAMDAVRHGTSPALKLHHPLGIEHHNAVLTEDDIRCIRAEPAFRGVCEMLARAFGVTNSTIARVRSGRTWGHVRSYVL